MPALTRRDAAAGGEVGQGGEAGSGPDLGVGVHTGAHLQRGTRTDGDGPHLNLASGQVHQLQRHVLAQGGVIANVQEVPATPQQQHPPVDVHPLADACPQGPQGGGVQARAREQGPGHQPHRLLHHPVAGVKAAPHRS